EAASRRLVPIHLRRAKRAGDPQAHQESRTSGRLSVPRDSRHSRKERDMDATDGAKSFDQANVEAIAQRVRWLLREVLPKVFRDAAAALETAPVTTSEDGLFLSLIDEDYGFEDFVINAFVGGAPLKSDEVLIHSCCPEFCSPFRPSPDDSEDLLAADAT